MHCAMFSKGRVSGRWIALALIGGSLAGFAPARGADPVEEYKRQLVQPLEVLNKQTASITERRLAAAKVAEWAKLRRRVVSELYIGLGDPDEQVRLSALEVIAEVGPLADNSIPRLNWMVVNDPSEKVRALAAGALIAMYYPRHFGAAPFLEKQAVESLRQALKDKSKEVRLRTAFRWC